MKEKTYSLICNAQAGDKTAMEEIVKNNTGLIWKAVKRFSGRGVDNDDLFQIGAMGLIKSVNKFNTEFEVEFSTYAVPMIIGEIRRFLRDDGIIKISRSIKETSIKARAAAEKILFEKGSEASISEIAQRLDISPEDVAISLEATREPESIYKTVHDGDNSAILLIDKLNSGENNEESILNNIALKNAIKNLPQRERQILLLRYFREKTQSEVAGIMGLSQVQISRIEKKLLTTLKKDIC